MADKEPMKLVQRWVIFDKVFIIVGICDCILRFGPRECHAVILSVLVILCAPVDGEMTSPSLMNNSTTLVIWSQSSN